MIAELFLVCALAVPSTQIRDSLNTSDVKVVQILLSDVQTIKVLLKAAGKEAHYQLPKKRIILLIGGLPDLINPLLVTAEQVWRLTIFDETVRDIVGSFFNQPFRRASASMVIFRMYAPANRWGSMRALVESIYAVAPGGYFLFDPVKCVEFVKHMDRYGFEKLPIRWKGHLIYIRNANPSQAAYGPGAQSIDRGA